MKQDQWIRLSLLLLLLTGILLTIVFRNQVDVATVVRWTEEAGPAAPLIFMMIYMFGTVLFLPGSVLTLTGGALFGPVLGTVCSLTGATLGATLAFLVARYLASEWVERKAGSLIKQVMQGVESEGWRFVAFVRLVPLFPFNLLNYLLGLTRIRLSHYIVTSYVCMFPGALAYTYLGYAGREALAGRGDVIRKGLVALGLLALVLFVPRFIRRLRAFPMISAAELKQRLDLGEDILVLDVRSREEFSGEMGHVPGALNLAVEELQKRIAELEEYRGRQIAIVCLTDKRSVRAAGILATAGFSSLTVVRGGMEQWRRHGLPVER